MPKKKYAVIKIPIELAEEVDRVVGTRGYRSRTEFIKDAIRSLLREYEREGKLLPAYTKER